MKTTRAIARQTQSFEQIAERVTNLGTKLDQLIERLDTPLQDGAITTEIDIGDIVRAAVNPALAELREQLAEMLKPARKA